MTRRNIVERYNRATVEKRVGMSKNCTKVRNIKKYMLASLFNAPTTIKSYYQAEVNHNMVMGK